jgi:hypothetical protein
MNVRVSDGDVCFETPPDVIVDVKLDGEIAGRPELDLNDFALPVESCRLLVHIDSLKNGVLEKIVVYDGIPRRVVFRGPFPEVRK